LHAQAPVTPLANAIVGVMVPGRSVNTQWPRPGFPAKQSHRRPCTTHSVRGERERHAE
jgi:hypothetical protein